MKFTNGYWMIRDGVDALYAREAYELAADATTESLNVLAPTSVVRGRYDTLNLPTFNVDITTPAEGVIRVCAEHWQGATEYPGFRVKGQNVCLARRVAGVRFGLFECRLSGCSRCR